MASELLEALAFSFLYFNFANFIRSDFLLYLYNSELNKKKYSTCSLNSLIAILFLMLVSLFTAYDTTDRTGTAELSSSFQGVEFIHVHLRQPQILALLKRSLVWLTMEAEEPSKTESSQII